MTGIVDYNAGNVRSVERALAFLGAPFVRSADPRELEKCGRLLFPGVGEAAYAMEMLRGRGLDSFLRSWAADGRPLVGVCLGSQVIFGESEEGGAECLGLIPGRIRHFRSVWGDAGISPALKVPHMGWSSVRSVNGGCPLMDGIPDGTDFYFVHSYLIQADEPSVVRAVADYGCEVPACVSSGSVTAFQFHPEKSGRAGLRILANFVRGDIDFEAALARLSAGGEEQDA